MPGQLDGLKTQRYGDGAPSIEEVEATIGAAPADLRAALADMDAVVKHLGSKHDQHTHGGKGGVRSDESSADSLAARFKSGGGSMEITVRDSTGLILRDGTGDMNIKAMFGNKMDAQELARLSGMPDGSKVSIRLDAAGHSALILGTSYKMISNDGFAPPLPNGYREPINPKYEDINASRKLFTDHRGKLVMYDEQLSVKNAPRGMGTHMLARQVKAARDNGVDAITCMAAGNPKSAGQEGRHMNGYYTWPRLGYDAKLSDNHFLRTGDGGSKRERWEREYGPNVSDMMKSPRGRTEWKENGRPFDAEFDPRPDSQSSKVLDAYMAENRYEVAKGATPDLISGNLHERYDLTPEQDALLDRIWDELK